jgi:hypothetical protein
MAARFEIQWSDCRQERKTSLGNGQAGAACLG